MRMVFILIVRVSIYHHSSPESDNDNNNGNNSIECSLHFVALMEQM